MPGMKKIFQFYMRFPKTDTHNENKNTKKKQKKQTKPTD